MGDRVSISFRDSDGEESPALFHHWGGTNFPESALAWFKAFKGKAEAESKARWSTPINRLEARIMLAQFLSFLGKEKAERNIKTLVYNDGDNPTSGVKEVLYDDDVLSQSIYMGADKNDGDNSDNGHYVIHTDTATMEITKRPMEDYE